MKVSEITIQTICSHIREVEENLETQDVELLSAMKKAAINYCIGYTGLSEEELDLHEDITIVILTIISDMWDNRSLTIGTGTANRIVEGILGMHCVNFLPEGDE